METDQRRGGEREIVEQRERGIKRERESEEIRTKTLYKKTNPEKCTYINNFILDEDKEIPKN